MAMAGSVPAGSRLCEVDGDVPFLLAVALVRSASVLPFSARGGAPPFSPVSGETPTTNCRRFTAL